MITYGKINEYDTRETIAGTARLFLALFRAEAKQNLTLTKRIKQLEKANAELTDQLATALKIKN